MREDPAVDTRLAAAMARSMIPPASAAPAVPALTSAAVGDESPRVRSAARSLLQRTDPAAFRRAADQVRTAGPISSKTGKRDGQIFYQGRSLGEWIERLSVSYIPNEIFGRPRSDEPLAAIRDRTGCGAGADRDA